MKLATDYIDNIISGKIDCCEYVKASIRRHVNDLSRQRTDDFPYYFDEHEAEKPIKFFFIARHYKGEFKGKKFIPEPWQAAILWITFGWRELDGSRKFKYQYIEVPRKNGKSTFIAVEHLFLLISDGENAPEIYFTATTQAQASIVFREAREIARQTPEFSSRLNIQEYIIKNESNKGFMKALGGDSKTQDGLNPSGAALDEYHEHKTDSMFDVIDTAFGMRRQPLMSVITTAGFNKNYPCYKYRDHCIKVLNGVVQQEDLFAIIYTIDDEDDWKDEKTWIKANPSWRIMNQKDYRNQAHQAKINPYKEVSFLTKKLNVWTNAESIWMRDEDWMKCAGPVVPIDELKGVPCYAGLDLASTQDITALVLNFPRDGKRYIKCWFWIPEFKVSQKEDIVDYYVWRKEKFINVVGGNQIDIDDLTFDIYEILKKFNVKGLAYDRWASAGVIQGLEKLGFPKDKMDPYKQTVLDMTMPVKELEGSIIAGTLNHEGNPVLRWMASNVVMDVRSDGSMKFSKDKSIDKIDGMVALAMAVGEELTLRGDQPISFVPTFFK